MAGTEEAPEIVDGQRDVTFHWSFVGVSLAVPEIDIVSFWIEDETAETVSASWKVVDLSARTIRPGEHFLFAYGLHENDVCVASLDVFYFPETGQWRGFEGCSSRRIVPVSVDLERNVVTAHGLPRAAFGDVDIAQGGVSVLMNPSGLVGEVVGPCGTACGFRDYASGPEGDMVVPYPPLP